MSSFQTKADSNNEKLEFAEFYGGMIRSLKNIKALAHIGSGITESVVIYQVVNSKLHFGSKALIVVISMIVTSIIIWIIEGGLSKWYPYYSRQVIRGKFHNRWYWLMFVGMSFLIFPLLIASPLLSGYGGKDIVQSLTTEVQRASIDSIEQKAAIKSDSIMNIFKTEAQHLATLRDSKIKSIRNEYKGKRSIHYTDLKKYKQLKKNGHTWAIGHITKLNKQVAGLEAKEAEEIKHAKENYLKSYNDKDGFKSTALLSVKAEKDRLVEQIDESYTKQLEQREAHVFIWGGAMFYLALFCSLGTIICMTIIEIYRAGAGQEYQKKIDEESSTFLSDFGSMIELQFSKIGNFILGKGKNETVVSNRRSIGFNNHSDEVQENDNLPESLETPNVQGETKFVSTDYTKIIQDARNHFRRGKTELYNKEKSILINAGYSIKEFPDRGGIEISK